MDDALHFHDFSIDRREHQLEPEDRATAGYLIVNRCSCVALTNIVITHPQRTDVNGQVVLSCEPSTIVIPGPLLPHEERHISVEIVTRGDLPGRHALRLRATFDCVPVVPETEGLFEVSITAD